MPRNGTGRLSHVRAMVGMRLNSPPRLTVVPCRPVVSADGTGVTDGVPSRHRRPGRHHARVTKWGQNQIALPSRRGGMIRRNMVVVCGVTRKQSSPRPSLCGVCFLSRDDAVLASEWMTAGTNTQAKRQPLDRFATIEFLRRSLCLGSATFGRASWNSSTSRPVE